MNTVEFPGLWGLELPLPRVAFSIGSIEIYWYGIIIAFGFMIAVLLGLKNSKKFELNPEDIIDVVLFGAPAAVIFARIYYVVFNWSEFSNDPISVLYLRRGGIAIYGALIGALLAAYLVARHKKINFLKLVDFGIVYFVLAQAIGRWGNFVNQEAFGANTTLPWGMTSDSVRQYLEYNKDMLAARGIEVDPMVPVHPTFLYESLWNLAVFFMLIWFRKKKKLNGEVFFAYMILYGLGRAVIEGLRTDSLMLGSFRISQLLAVLFVIAFIVLFIMRRQKSKNAEEIVEVGTSRYGDILKTMKEEESKVAEAKADEDVKSGDGIESSEAAGEEVKPEDDAQNNESEKETKE